MKLSLGIELGSTRIKATLIDEKCNEIASGSHQWESKLRNGYWTYSMNEVQEGLQICFKHLVTNYKNATGKELDQIDAMGVSAMMHGYLAFDKNQNLLVPFRTWRNTTTAEASTKLTKLFNFNIPERWSIAHLYQAILNNEPHIKDISYITTLAGYVHYKLTGQFVLGIGDASGMFPIDQKTRNYDMKMVAKFDKLVKDKVKWKLLDILPTIKLAGEPAGYLTEEGRKYLNTDLKCQTLFCPPEGDAGTGMVATNSVRNQTGNVSAGTSVFAMVVTTKKLHVHPEIDMVTTPTGLPVAMVHCNNCTNELNDWVNLFAQAAKIAGADIKNIHTFQNNLILESLKGDKDANKITVINYLAGESITKIPKGKPIVVRSPDADFSLTNFMKANIMSAFATLKIGMDILAEEGIVINNMYAQGGIFTAPKVAQELLSAAIDCSVSLLTNAETGGSYGMALLANYMITKKNQNLENWLDNTVFKNTQVITLKAKKDAVDGFKEYLKRFIKYLAIERKAIEE